MNTTDLNNVDTATDLSQDKRELIKQMQRDFKMFNEQQRLFEKMTSNLFPACRLHENLLPIFKLVRKDANIDNLADNDREVFAKLKNIETFEGLTFHEMAKVFNYMDLVSDFVVEQLGINLDEYKEVYEHTYNECAIAIWNKQADVWRGEIAGEKLALIDNLNKNVQELNAELKAATKATKAKRKKSNPAPLKASYTKKEKQADPVNN